MLAKEEVTIDGDLTQNSSTDFLWGLGAEVTLGFIGLRVEWEIVERGSESDLSVLSLGFTTRF